MKATNPNLFPAEYKCNVCQKEKSVAEMMVVYIRKLKIYYLRPRCKACHNERERGHRREYKTKYLQQWRKNNAKLNRSYWNNAKVREQNRVNGYRRFQEKHEAILIQGRLSRHGIKVSIQEAEKLLNKFGRCYPTRFGLTPAGLKECERIRSSMRRTKRRLKLTPLEIRMMVYEDGFFIKPSRQPVPYKSAAKTLRKWHQSQGISK